MTTPSVPNTVVCFATARLRKQEKTQAPELTLGDRDAPSSPGVPLAGAPGSKMAFYGAVIAMLYLQASNRSPAACAALRAQVMAVLNQAVWPAAITLPPEAVAVKDITINEVVQFLSHQFYEEQTRRG